MLRILIVSLILAAVCGFSLPRLPNKALSLAFSRTIMKPAATVSLIVASQIFNVADVRADLESLSSPPSPVKTIQVVSTSEGSDVSTSSSEEERVRRKLEKQARASGSEGKVDDTYLGSLSREKSKQEKLKKTKGERSKDLCEMLGRGC